MRVLRVFACLAASVLQVGAAAAAYEGFAYPGGSSLAGQAGGSGWGDSWDGSKSALAANIGTGLAFGSLSTLPGSVSSDPPVSGQVAFLSRQLGASIGADNTTTFLSFLLRPDPGFGFYGGVNLEGLFIGKSGPTTTYGIEGPVNDIDSSKVAATSGRTVLLVLRADFLPGNDRFSLFVDPSPGLPEPSIADSVKTDFDLPPVNFVFVNNAGGWTTDEIRIGSTFASVTPVPEPAILYFFAVALPLLGLSVHRCRARG